MKSIQLFVAFTMSIPDDEDESELFIDIPLTSVKVQKFNSSHLMREKSVIDIAANIYEYETIDIQELDERS